MFDHEENDLERDVEASMRLFKRAMVGPAAELEAADPKRVLLVLDGSSQDESVVAAAAYLQSQLGVQLQVLDLRSEFIIEDPGAKDRGDAGEAPPKDAAAAPSPRAIGLKQLLPDTQTLPAGEGPAYDRICAAITEQTPDLVIVPCPFARDFESIGSDSAGTVIDVLLNRSPVPLLVIRRNDQPLEEATKEIAVVVGAECESEARAAGWALCLAAPRAQLTLSLVIDREQYENMRALMDVISPENSLDISQLNDAMAESHARLHASINKAAASRNLKYRLQPMAYEDAPPSVLSAARPMLVVLPTEKDDRYCQGFVQDRIRRSPHPVLVVPRKEPVVSQDE
ncbi:universal stress protein [Roseimaritima sediminicola]|uniref:universal stress protein n=1 Tax=Roseimaritima sediminicola TaxID=2662066 RepID=UPI0012983758|nr:universal stress protein [Roseimaritima sediminicola]